MSTTAEDRPIVHRRPRTPGADRKHSFAVPDETWEAAKRVAHARGFSVGSYLVAKLEELAAETP